MQLDASSNGLGAEGARVFGEMLRINQTLVVLNLSENGMGDEDEEGQWTRAEEAMLAFGTSIEMLEPHFEEPKDESKEATVEMICNAMTKQDSAVDSSAFKEAMLQAFENPVPACLQALADGLKANTRVQQLNPFGNTIPEDTLRTIMNSNKNISNFGGAVKLDYSGIGMDSTDAKVLAELLKANVTVQGLDASGNKLGPKGGKAIAGALKTNQTLCTIVLSGKDKNITIHVDQLRQNTVDTLDYSGQGLHVDGGTFIVAELLKENTSVTKVSN